MRAKAWLVIVVALLLAAAAFLWLRPRGSGVTPEAAVQPTGAVVEPAVSELRDAVRSVEPEVAVAPPPARQQVEPELRDESSARVELESQRISVRLTSATGESLDAPFKNDRWQGGYASQIAVVPTSEPLPFEVSALKLERLRCGKYTRVAAAGNSFSGIVPNGISGIIELDRPPPAFANAMLRGRLLASAPIDAETREVVLVIDSGPALAALGGVTFRLITKGTNEPVAKAGVSLSEHATGKWANPAQMPLEGGRFERQRLPPGSYELQIRLPGYDHIVRTFEVVSGRTTDLGDLMIEEGGAARGRVVDEAGNGLSVPLVWAAIDARAGPSFIQQATSDVDGQFVIAEFPASGVLLQIHDPQWALDPVTLRMKPGAVMEDVVLVARRGVPVALRAQFDDDVEFELVLRRADGLALWSTRSLGPSRHEVRLVPGSYALEALRVGVQTVSSAFQVADQRTFVTVAQ